MKALFIAAVWPEPRSSAAGFRTLSLMRAVRDQDWQLEVYSPCQDNEARTELERLGIFTRRIPPNDPSFDQAIRDYEPDLVLFDRFMTEEQFSWRVATQCPEALRVLDTSDLHSLRRARQRQLETGGELDLSSGDAIREIASIYRSDLSLIISDFEIELLTKHYGVPPELLSLTRFFYSQPEPGLGFAERKHFVTIGNFRHNPNLDSFRMLAHGLWRKIRERLPTDHSDAELHLYGAYPTAEFMRLDSAQTGFRVKGPARDARETLGRYRVNLAPLRFGAGIKGKITDGWAVGTPCAATPIAIEGMLGDLDPGGLVGELDETFAKNAVQLYTEQPLWETARENGTKLMHKIYDASSNAYLFIQTLERALSEKRQRRTRNFIGAMLWHHSARSTEYFSRWIELKRRDRPQEETSLR